MRETTVEQYVEQRLKEMDEQLGIASSRFLQCAAEMNAMRAGLRKKDPEVTAKSGTGVVCHLHAAMAAFRATQEIGKAISQISTADGGPVH